MLSLRTGARWFQRFEPSKVSLSLHSSAEHSQGALLESIQDKVEAFKKYRRGRQLYKEAEKSARETLQSQISMEKDVPSLRERADASRHMTNNMTSPRSWRLDNAGAVREEEATR